MGWKVSRNSKKSRSQSGCWPNLTQHVEELCVIAQYEESPIADHNHRAEHHTYLACSRNVCSHNKRSSVTLNDVGESRLGILSCASSTASMTEWMSMSY